MRIPPKVKQPTGCFLRHSTKGTQKLLQEDGPRDLISSGQWNLAMQPTYGAVFAHMGQETNVRESRKLELSF